MTERMPSGGRLPKRWPPVLGTVLFGLAMFIACAGSLWILTRAVTSIADDPDRWSKPDVYVCLLASAYAGWAAALISSSAVRDSPWSWWRTLVNPGTWSVLAFGWVSQHSWPLVYLTLFFMACTSSRQAGAALARAFKTTPKLRIDSETLSTMTRDAPTISAASR